MKASGRLAFFRATADSAFWSDHWSGESLDHLLSVAETSPLTHFINRHLRPGDCVLEGGCGLGQYVILFARRGYRVTGVDFSEDAVASHLALHPSSDVCVGDLTSLSFGDHAFDAYISLGVIEHYRDCGAAILREAHRVLKPDGRLILSVPYLSLTRRVLRRRIERQQEAAAASGGEFYQYAFTRQALDETLNAEGFRIGDRSYYDVGRGVRDMRSLFRAGGDAESGALVAAVAPARGRAKAAMLTAGRAAARSRPMLKTFAHMQIVCAVRP